MRQPTAAKQAPAHRKPEPLRNLAVRGRRADRIATDRAAEAQVTRLARANPYM